LDWLRQEHKQLRFSRPTGNSAKHITDEMLEAVADSLSSCPGVKTSRLTTTKKAILVHFERLGPASKQQEKFEQLVKTLCGMIVTNLVAEARKAKKAARHARGHTKPAFANDSRRSTPAAIPVTT
jgi:hypothetical protein